MLGLVGCFGLIFVLDLRHCTSLWMAVLGWFGFGAWLVGCCGGRLSCLDYCCLL